MYYLPAKVTPLPLPTQTAEEFVTSLNDTRLALAEEDSFIITSGLPESADGRCVSLHLRAKAQLHRLPIHHASTN